MSIIKGTKIKKIYGGGEGFVETIGLNNVDIEVEKGEFTAIMGPSGSGKSTLMNILSGFDSPTSGDVLINQTDIHGLSSDDLALFRRSFIGYIFQEFNLLDSLTIKENIMLPMILDKAEASEMSNKAEALMHNLGISHVRHKYPYQVSGGQQQRAAVCRALMNGSGLVFADEPTGNLDSKSSRAVLESLKQANSLYQSTILLVTHDPIAASYSDRVYFLKDGRIKTQINKKNTQDNFVKDILDCLAVLEEVEYEI